MSDIKIAIPSLPVSIDSMVVNSATDYIVLNQLLRSLVTYSCEGKIIGDLADSWKVSKDYMEYTFYIKDHQYFSDGSLITSCDVKNSWERGIKYFTGSVHYSFSKIKDIIIVSDFELKILFYKPEPTFLSSLDFPELRILHSSDYTSNRGEQKFKVTSGAYVLDGRDNCEMILKKNIHFDKHLSSSPCKVYIVDNSAVNVDSLKNDNIDLFWALTEFDKDTDNKVKSLNYKSYISQHGFCFWITINQKSKKLKSIKTRKWLQNILNVEENFFADDIFLSGANHLYMGHGPGRLTDEEIEREWILISEYNNISVNLEELSLLVSKSYPFKEQIVKILKSKNINVKVNEYSNFNEYDEIINSEKEFDLIQVNNDFSDIDLVDCLKVTFNKSRPLINVCDNSKLDDLLEKMDTCFDSCERSRIYKDIGINILSDGLVIPQYQFNMLIYYKVHIDLSEWSKVVFDASFYKLKVGK